MLNIKNAFVGIVSAIVIVPSLIACDTGVEFEANAPILEAAGLSLKPKVKPEPDLPERAPLVIPPRAAGDLPPPGSGQAPAAAAVNGQWPKDPVDQKKLAAQKAEEERKRYCREGNWKDAKGIDDFNKNTGLEARCRPEWIDKIVAARDQQK